MSFLVDTHCHLDLFKDIQLNKQAENQLGIKTITVTNAPSFFKPNTQLFKECTNIRVGLGLHPQLAHQYEAEIELFEHLVKDTRYIGEIGLDGSAELKSTYTSQRKLMEKILAAVKKQDNKILTVHSRNAASETIDIIYRYLKGSSSKVILHWYSGGISDLKDAVSKGFYFSINHKMVNTDKGKEIIKNIPMDRLLTETDAPFTFVGTVSNRIKSLTATINGISLIAGKPGEQIQQTVFDNFKHLLDG
jgi:TatD DNase family protein